MDAVQAVKLGRAFPQYQPLPPRSERVAARLAVCEREHSRAPSPTVRSKIEAQETRKDRRAVAGYAGGGWVSFEGRGSCGASRPSGRWSSSSSGAARSSASGRSAQAVRATLANRLCKT